MIFEEQFPVPSYTAASKIGNSVISLLRQLRCRCNPGHNKFSSLSNTSVVAIFPKLCFWRRSSCSNLGGTNPEKLYRATLRCSGCQRLILRQQATGVIINLPTFPFSLIFHPIHHVHVVQWEPVGRLRARKIFHESMQ